MVTFKRFGLPYNPQKDKKNKNKTIFVFEETEKFINDMASVKKH